MRKRRTDYRLWAILSAGLFVAAVAVGYAADPRPSLAGRAVLLWKAGPAGVTTDEWVWLGWEAFWLAGVLTVPAWVLQAAAGRCGVRLARRRDPAQAADYDDAPPAPPGP